MVNGHLGKENAVSCPAVAAFLSCFQPRTTDYSGSEILCAASWSHTGWFYLQIDPTCCLLVGCGHCSEFYPTLLIFYNLKSCTIICCSPQQETKNKFTTHRKDYTQEIIGFGSGDTQLFWDTPMQALSSIISKLWGSSPISESIKLSPPGFAFCKRLTCIVCLVWVLSQSESHPGSHILPTMEIVNLGWLVAW